MSHTFVATLGKISGNRVVRDVCPMLRLCISRFSMRKYLVFFMQFRIEVPGICERIKHVARTCKGVCSSAKVIVVIVVTDGGVTAACEQETGVKTKMKNRSEWVEMIYRF